MLSHIVLGHWKCFGESRRCLIASFGESRRCLIAVTSASPKTVVKAVKLG